MTQRKQHASGQRDMIFSCNFRLFHSDVFENRLFSYVVPSLPACLSRESFFKRAFVVSSYCENSPPIVESFPRRSSRLSRKDMCKVHYQQLPRCYCIGISAKVEICAVFPCLPENKDKTTFRPKVITSHCQGLDVCFNGVDYVSDDVEGGESDFVPKGLDCPHVEIGDEGDDPWPCALCDNEAALKFLKAKGIEYTFDKAAREREMQEEAAEGAEGEKAAAKGVERSKGKSAARPGSISSAVEGAGKEFNRAREMIKKRESRAAGRRARSGLAQSTSASTE